MESALNHPQERVLIVRPWMVEYTGDHCAAAILSILDFWHGVKVANSEQARKFNDVAEGHHDPRTQYEGILQWHTTAELKEMMFGLFGVTKIKQSIKKLEELGCIKTCRNPNPRYHFDKTKHFALQTGVINRWLRERDEKSRNNAIEESTDAPSNTWNATINTWDKSGSRVDSPDRAIPEISSEITTEISTETISPKGSPSPSDESAAQVEVIEAELIEPDPEEGAPKKVRGFSDFKDAYNREKPEKWAEMSVVNKKREKVFRSLIKDFGSRDAALKTLVDALSFAKGEEWFFSKDLSFENFSSKGKITELAERWRQRQRFQSKPVIEQLHQSSNRYARNVAECMDYFEKLGIG